MVVCRWRKKGQERARGRCLKGMGAGSAAAAQVRGTRVLTGTRLAQSFHVTAAHLLRTYGPR